MNKVIISRKIFSLFLLLVFSIAALPQQHGHRQTAKLAGKIEAYLYELEQAGFSGTVLVELGGKRVISRGFGFRDFDRKLPNTPDTIFDIGSITKQFTAAAILKLEMQGRLDTGDKISRHLADVPEDKAAITIHQLLRHESGLPAVVGGDYEKITEDEFIKRVFESPLKFKSGTRFSYSNVGYSLLGIIIERVSGQSYEEFLYENLWKPAVMQSTGYRRPSFERTLFAAGYKNDERWGLPSEKEWDENGPYWHLKANGGLLSTAEDLYKWHLALAKGRILSDEAKQKYYHPPLREGERDNPFYAYGWDVFKTKRNTRLVSHNGTNRVFYADFFRYLDENAAIIVLSNRAHDNFVELNRQISKLIFEPGFKPAVPVADNAANRRFTDEVLKITLEKGIKFGIRALKRRAPAVDLLESVVNRKGYSLLSAGDIGRAIDVFTLNTVAFPKSANAFDSLGEAYLEAGKRDLAAENYKKSLLLDPDNRNAEEALKRLMDK